MTLTPGLYRATVRGVADQIVMLAADYALTDPWVSLNPVPARGARWHSHKSITDARPLIVLDLGDLISPEKGSDGWVFLCALKNNMLSIGRDMADQIEAQTKPPRIPEPMRWGSKVRTARATYVLLDIATLGRRWLDEHDGQLYKWDALADPTLIREGVES